MIKNKIQTSTILILLSVITYVAYADSDSLSRMEAIVKERFGKGLVVEETFFDGVYTFYRSSEPDQAGVRLIDIDETFVVNNGRDGWKSLDNQSPLTAETIASIQRRAAASVSLSDAIIIKKGSAPVSMMILEAVDCSACIRLEKFLAKQKFSYGVFPTTLKNDDKRIIAKSVWCDVDPVRAWTTVMLTQTWEPTQGKCDYPEARIQSVNSMFNSLKGVLTPKIFFADGDASLQVDPTDYSDGNLSRKHFIKYVENKIKNNVIFGLQE